MKKRIGLVLSVLFAAGTLLSACGQAGNNAGGGNQKDTFSVAMVTDVGGIDDKSFNQSAWEGLQKFGKDNGLEKGRGGYDYLQSSSDADYATNLNKLVRSDFDLIFGIGYLMGDAVKEVAKQNPKNISPSSTLLLTSQMSPASRSRSMKARSLSVLSPG